MDDGRLYTTIEVSRMTGATAAQLKNWDKQGVLCPQRSGEGQANNRKLYSDADIETVRDILLFQDLGMTLKDIHAVLNAPPNVQRQRIAECTDRLRLQYDQLSKRIALSTLGESMGTAQLREAAELAGGYTELGDAFAKEENLRQVMHWIETRPAKDMELFAEELRSMARELDALRQASDYGQVELAIARFCDFWSKRFGWPSCGQLLTLHVIFSGDNALGDEIDAAAGEGAAKFLADMLMLAWISAAVECLDDILAHLYRVLLEKGGHAVSENRSAIESVAGILSAFACEFSDHAYAFSPEPSGKQAARLSELAASVFDLIVDAALDEELGGFLDLDGFAAIDGPSLESARAATIAYLAGSLDAWLDGGGVSELQQRAHEWLGTLEAEWRLESPRDTVGCPEDAASQGEATLDDPEFRRWFDRWFANAHPSPPKAARACEEESNARIRRTLEAVRQNGTRE